MATDAQMANLTFETAAACESFLNQLDQGLRQDLAGYSDDELRSLAADFAIQPNVAISMAALSGKLDQLGVMQSLHFVRELHRRMVCRELE